MKLYIDYMVSIRCKLFVKSELGKIGLQHCKVDFAVVETTEFITSKQKESLNEALLPSGMRLMEDKNVILLERLKNIIAEMINSSDDFKQLMNSEYIAKQFSQGYAYLDKLFSEATGITIEQFIIHQKIDRAKELLVYGEFSLTEISNILNYSSVAHLHAQFKKITGLTPSFFINIKKERNKLIKGCLNF